MSTMTSDWLERVGSFRSCPSKFLSETNPEVFLTELLRELRDDRASYSVKMVLLSPLCEYPTLLCLSDPAGEETALDLMSVFAQCPPASTQFRCQLLVALTCVLISSSCVRIRSRASLDFLGLVFQVVRDTSDISRNGPQRSLRATACDCLRELEDCCPSLLTQHLELLGGLRQQETSGLHQAYVGLHTVVLRNAVYRLSQEPGAGAEHLKALLGGTTSADQDSFQTEGKDSAGLGSLILGPMGSVPTLHTGADCKELKSILSSLLEESYLLTPLYQVVLLHRLTEVVAMVPGVPPAILRAQLLRLLGTSEVCLFHVALLMKGAFTDSLFSAEDEAFVLKRLVVLSQHPVLSTPEKLFYMDCILHFPENRPISCGDSDEALPVLLTPQLAAALLPTLFNDGATLLARLRLLSLVYLEEGEVGGRGLAYLYDQLMSLLRVVESGGNREIVVTFFRAAFLFLLSFSHVEQFCSGMSRQLCQLYLQHPQLAPHLINMANQTQERLSESSWASGLLRGLQKAITEVPPAQLTLQALGWHLKVLARVAEEAEIGQRSSLNFLSSVIASSSLSVGGNWRLGNCVLGVCRCVLLHPTLDSLLIPLADILQHLSCYHGDTDIQDHARLYYSLLTTLSQEKLVAMLAQGSTTGGHQVKKRMLSCLMAESEGLTSMLTAHQTSQPILRLTEAPQQLELKQNCDPQGTEVDKASETYRAQFSDPHFASEIPLKYQLTHTEGSDPRFDQIFSIRLHFSLTDRHYEQLEDMSVPCLFRERPPPIVKLRLKPRQPYPTTLHISAIFTTRDGFSWHTELPDVHVAFQQVFLPLPAPPNWAPGSRLKVFQELWDEICSEAGDGAVSLFCCQLRGPSLKALLKEHLLPFLLSDPSGEEEFRVLVFLPPQNHVLLKIRAEEDAVHFNMASDNWQLLPHVNSYLLTVTSDRQLLALF
ncbi:AP-5 complex subunit beta-1 [Kryptolebias marmoratus]|uniref:AP-5 complex subunit beta-1 n=1 Tax=Kryptolebias marmoratus TaxID=37003 RepID=A0A3Q3BDW2_KRYMA|nr:AP-5 complex subunit beta-1 [Kryptolebias marmoratus]